MRELEQNLERSKSADDVVSNYLRHGRDKGGSLQPRSRTTEHVCRPQNYVQRSPQGSLRTCSTGSKTPNKQLQQKQAQQTQQPANYSIEDRLHLLTPGVPHYGPPGGNSAVKHDSVIETRSLGESMEGISISGFSDIDPAEDDLSDTETDNEWEGSEVTRV